MSRVCGAVIVLLGGYGYRPIAAQCSGVDKSSPPLHRAVVCRFTGSAWCAWERSGEAAYLGVMTPQAAVFLLGQTLPMLEFRFETA